MTIFYVLSVVELIDYIPLWKVLSLIASIGLYGICGVLVNDFFDMPTDIQAGEYREIHNIPKTFVIILIILIASLSYAVTLTLIKQTLYTLIYSIVYILATFYSATPIRLKSRGIYGIIINVLIEQALPVLLVVKFFYHLSLDVIFLLVLVSLRQLEIIIIHQYVDYEGDKEAGIRTFVVEVGTEKTVKILKYLQPLVALLYAIFSLIIIVQRPYFAIFFIPLIAGYFLLSELRRSELFTSEQGKSGPPRYYAENEKVGGFRHSLSSFLGISFEGPFSIFAGTILTIKFHSYIVLLLLSIVSQYYFIKGHYRAALQGALQFVTRSTKVGG